MPPRPRRHRLDQRRGEDLRTRRVSTRAPSRQSPARAGEIADRSRQTATIGVPGSSRSARKSAVPRLPMPITPSRTGLASASTAAASARFPCERARLAAAEQPKNRRRFKAIGGGIRGLRDRYRAGDKSLAGVWTECLAIEKTLVPMLRRGNGPLAAPRRLKSSTRESLLARFQALVSSIVPFPAPVFEPSADISGMVQITLSPVA